VTQLIFSILSLQCFKHPIHIPSVLFLFSIRPENEPNVSIILKAIDISILVNRVKDYVKCIGIYFGQNKEE
jgi:hypothetical protein